MYNVGISSRKKYYVVRRKKQEIRDLGASNGEDDEGRFANIWWGGTGNTSLHVRSLHPLV